MALIATLVSLSVVCAVVAILSTVCLVVVCRRKGGPVPPPSGPAHWSTTVTVTPECRPRGAGATSSTQQQQVPVQPTGQTQLPDIHHVNGGRGTRQDQQDRMALIAFADGAQVRETITVIYIQICPFSYT